MNPLVSIIIPIYNAEDTLHRAVGSALSQDWENVEVLLIDDGSTDGSGEACDRIAAGEPRVRIFHMNDCGVSAARNLGLEKAQGDFVTFLDGDDTMSPKLVSELMRVHQETHAQICGCTFTSCGPQETEPAGLGEGTGQIRVRTGGDIITNCILQRDTRVWSKLFAREAVGETRFREGLTIGEDMLFVLSLVCPPTRYALLDRKLYGYTVNPKGAMERPFAPSYMDQLTCWDLAEDVIRRRMPELLEGRNAAQLASLKIVSGTLTASKIAKLPGGPEKYAAEFETCRRYTAQAMKVRGAASLLPKDYKIKSRLLLHAPGIYCRIYGARG